MTPTRWPDIRHLEWHLLEKYGVYVSFDDNGTDEYWFDPDNFEEDPGVISINSLKDAEHQLLVLLHETGHVILRSDPAMFKKRFPDSCRGTLHGRIEILREEVLAWEEALRVADRLGIKVEEEKWKENYRDALEKYVRWTLTGDENEQAN